MSNGSEFINLMAKIMPYELLSKQLKEALDRYEEDRSKENLDKLQFAIALVLYKIDNTLPEEMETLSRQVELGRQIEDMKKDLLG